MWPRAGPATHRDTLNAFSAGIEPRRIDPLAIQVMKEAGVDISSQETHSVQAFLKQDIDYAILVCSEAAEACPAFPAGITMIHQPFDEPPQLTQGMREGDRLPVYRRVRDEIRSYVTGLPGLLAQTPQALAKRGPLKVPQAAVDRLTGVYRAAGSVGQRAARGQPTSVPPGRMLRRHPTLTRDNRGRTSSGWRVTDQISTCHARVRALSSHV